MRRVFVLAIAVAALLTACAGTTTDQPPESEEPMQSETPSPAGPVGDLDADMIASVLALAEDETGVAADEITVVSAEAVTWSDGSLGCPEEGMMYTQALVEGYRVVLDVAGEEMHFHASEAGDFRPCADPIPPVEGGGGADR